MSHHGSPRSPVSEDEFEVAFSPNWSDVGLNWGVKGAY
jgi:hypothetical protein